jgi:hypothetical protein
MISIIVRILALFSQMLVHLLNFNYLVTLPTSRQHRALLPIMDINRLSVKTRVVPIAKTACLLLWRLLRINILNLALGLLLLSFLFTYRSFSTLRIYVCRDIDLWILLLLLSFRQDVCFSERTFNLLDLSWSQIPKTVADLFTHRSVQLDQTFDCG